MGHISQKTKMLVLFETAAGFALFDVLDEGKISEVDDVWKAFRSVEKAKKVVSLRAWQPFQDIANALSAATGIIDGELSKPLKKFLKKNIVKAGLEDTLAVADAKLGGLIKEGLKIPCVASQSVFELNRGIRSQLEGLLEDVSEKDVRNMRLGVAHSLGRYKLKFSPDKVDTMIIQAIALLDDLDKELNTYSMRAREWYGWHFPEMSKLVTEHLAYCSIVIKMGARTNAKTVDLTDVLDESLIEPLRSAAQVSMGTEISEHDLANTQYRAELYDYLKNRMNAIAPNLTALVGELVGARLIAHTGSLINLSKQPASTVQILGAEKALFRALKTKHATPKYGLIYHATLVGQAASKNKGKMARMLAAKSSLAIRCDALGDEDTPSVGPEYRAFLEARLAQMEGRSLAEISSIKSVPRNTTKAYSATGAADDVTHNTADDSTLKSAKKRKLESDSDADSDDDEPVKKKKKTKAKDKSKKSKSKGKDKKSKDKSKKSKSKGKSKKSKK